MKTAFLLVATVAACLASFGTAARADVEASTFGPGGTYDKQGYIVHGINSAFGPPEQTVANTVSGTLSSVDVAVDGGFMSEPASVTLSLAANGPLTNLPLAATLLTLGNVTATNSDSIQTLTLSTPVALLGGTKYLLVMDPATDTDIAAWYQSPTTTGGQAVSSDGGMTYDAALGPDAAFDINATPLAGAHEPSTWAMLALGGGAVGGRAASARRRGARGRA